MKICQSIAVLSLLIALISAEEKDNSYMAEIDQEYAQSFDTATTKDDSEDNNEEENEEEE